MKKKAKYDLVAVGELLIDLIGRHEAESLHTTEEYVRYPGGSPSNLAANMAKLGMKTTLVASVGQDSYGRYLVEHAQENDVDTQHIMEFARFSTSLVVVSHSLGTPDVIIYRSADCEIGSQQLPEDLLKDTKLFHTTCFGLSEEPAQSSILAAAKLAFQHEAQLSIDLGYSEKIWPKRDEAVEVIKEYLSLKPFVKISMDDFKRIFPEEPPSKKTVIRTIHELGASVVCLTLGKEGSMVSNNLGGEPLFIPALSLERTGDGTGAGDAYWAGFLTAMLEGKPLKKCGEAAARLASVKLTYTGPLPPGVDKSFMYS